MGKPSILGQLLPYRADSQKVYAKSFLRAYYVPDSVNLRDTAHNISDKSPMFRKHLCLL